MNNSSLINYDNVTIPSFKYSGETKMYVLGNVFKNNVDRISEVGNAYAFCFFDTQYLKLFDTSTRNDLYSYAIAPDEDETMANTFSGDLLKDIPIVGTVPTGNEQIDNILKNIDISFVMNQLFAANNLTTGLSSLIVFYLLNTNQNEMFTNCLKYVNNGTDLNLYQVSRFIGHKIDFVFGLANGFMYAFSDCDKLIGRIKIVKYPRAGSSTSSILSYAKLIYNNNLLKDNSIINSIPLIGGNLTDIHIIYEGLLTSYKSIDINEDYDIILDGYSNDYGSYSNVNNALILPKFQSYVETGNSYIHYSLYYTSDLSFNRVPYIMTGFSEITPIHVYVTGDEFLKDVSVDFTYTDLASGSKVGSIVKLTTPNELGYYDITNAFLEVFDPNEVKFSFVYPNEINEVPAEIQLILHLDKIGKEIISYVTDSVIGDTSKHYGQYSYRNLAGKTLHVNYNNYEKPLIHIYNGAACFIAGTKITMANGLLKNIEDIQIGDYILDADGNAQEVIWNQPRKHVKSDHYKIYTLSDGKELGIIGDERILWNGKYLYISSISEISYKVINEECMPYEIWTTGKDTIIANGIKCGKIYSNIKCKCIRNVLKYLYKIIFLHNKDYKWLDYMHAFIGQKILRHKINF